MFVTTDVHSASPSTVALSECVSSQQVATPPTTLNSRARKQSGQSAKGGDGDELSMSESEGAKDEESCSTSANQINEQMQRMLNQLWVFEPIMFKPADVQTCR